MDSANTPLSRRERERQQRVEDFLRAAETLFASRGFHSTTMDDIAREAEYGTGTIYRYFESKEALYRELFRRKARRLHDLVTEAVGRETRARDRLCAFLRTKLAYFREHQAFLRLFATEVLPTLPTDTSCLSQNDEAICQKITNLVRQIFIDGMDSGEFRRTDPDLLTAAFRGLTTEPLLDLARRGQKIDIQQVEDFLLALIRDGLGAHPNTSRLQPIPQRATRTAS